VLAIGHDVYVDSAGRSQQVLSPARASASLPPDFVKHLLCTGSA